MLSQIAIIVIALLWAGMILGISLESWAKFKTPSLTKPVGLDVGRTVFAAFHKTQFILMLILVIGGLVAHFLLWDWFILVLIALILASQHYWLFPILSKRVAIIMTSENIAKSQVHALYGILEFIKLMLLLYLSLT